MISNKKNYFYTLITSFGSMATSSVVGFIAVPLGLKYFKTESYGVWTLISSVLVYLAVSNLGVNTSASILMAKCPGLKNKMLVLSRSVKLLLLFVSVVLAGFIVLNYFSRDWIFVLGNIPPCLVRQTYLAALILGVFYLINLPFSLISSTLNGFQRVYVENVFISALAVVNFLALLITITTKGDLVRLALLTGSFTLAFNLFKLAYVYFCVIRPAAADPYLSEPQICDQGELSYENILRTGSRFLFIGIAAMIVWNTDNFLISRLLGVAAVVPYSVTFKLYYIMFSTILMVNGSSLSLMGKEFGTQNWAWINKVYSNLLILTVIIGGAAWLVGLFFLRDVITIWVGREGDAGLGVVFFLGAYSYIFGMINLNSGLINTFNYTKNMPLVGWLEAVIKFAITFTGLKLWGLRGAAMGTFFGCLLSNTWILPMVLRRRSGGRLEVSNAFLLKHFLFIVFPLVCAGVLANIYATTPGTRFLGGCVAILIYVYSSYRLTPPAVREYISGLFVAFKARFAQA